MGNKRKKEQKDKYKKTSKGKGKKARENLAAKYQSKEDDSESPDDDVRDVLSNENNDGDMDVASRENDNVDMNVMSSVDPNVMQSVDPNVMPSVDPNVMPSVDPNVILDNDVRNVLDTVSNESIGVRDNVDVVENVDVMNVISNENVQNNECLIADDDMDVEMAAFSSQDCVIQAPKPFCDVCFDDDDSLDAQMATISEEILERHAPGHNSDTIPFSCTERGFIPPPVNPAYTDYDDIYTNDPRHALVTPDCLNELLGQGNDMNSDMEVEMTNADIDDDFQDGLTDEELVELRDGMQHLANTNRGLSDEEALENTKTHIRQLSWEQIDALSRSIFEHPGVRNLWRTRRAADMIYHEGIIDGNPITSSDQWSANNALVDEKVTDMLKLCTIICPRPGCGFQIKTHVIGEHLAKTFVASCKNGRCPYNKMKVPKTVDGYYWPANLVGTLLAMQMDSGIQGVNNICWATQMTPFSAPMYQRHSKFIMNMQKKMEEKNMPQVHRDIKAYYERHELGQVDNETGLLDITVSLDGVFSHIKKARQCTTYACEVNTGCIIDKSVSEKCFGCRNHDDLETVCERSEGSLWHGDSGELEKRNFLNLFGTSTRLGYRYKTWIGDGDMRTVAALQAAQPYGPDCAIDKIECANHLVNRVHRKLKKWGSEWDEDGFKKRDEARKKKQDDKREEARKKREKEEKRKERVRKQEEAERKRVRKREETERKREEAERKREEKARAKARGKGRGPGGELSPFLSSSPDNRTGRNVRQQKSTSYVKRVAVTYPLLSADADKNKVGTPSVKDVGEFLFPSKGSTRDMAVEEPPAASEVWQEATLESLDTPQETQGSSQEVSVPPEMSQEAPLESLDTAQEIQGFPQEEQPHPRSGTVAGNTSSDTGHGSGTGPQLDDPIDTNSQEDAQANLGSMPLVEIEEPPIGDLVPKPDLVPNWLKEKCWRGKNKNRPIAHLFTMSVLNIIGAHYRLAVYSHDTLADQKTAVFSVPWHQLDFYGSTKDQKEHFHRYCDQGRASDCQFQSAKASGEDMDRWERTTAKRLTPNGIETVEWTNGVYAGLNFLYPQAFAELLYKFEALRSDELLIRCSRQATTNMNESMHQKVALLVKKCKAHNTPRIEFGVGSLMLSQNFGYEKASLLHALGWVNPHILKGLRFKDERSFESAARKHRLEAGTDHHHRRKESWQVIGEDGRRAGDRDRRENADGDVPGEANEDADVAGSMNEDASGPGNRGFGRNRGIARNRGGGGRNRGGGNSGRRTNAGADGSRNVGDGDSGSGNRGGGSRRIRRRMRRSAYDRGGTD